MVKRRKVIKGGYYYYDDDDDDDYDDDDEDDDDDDDDDDYDCKRSKKKKVIKRDDDSKKRKVIEPGNCHRWSELPADLLESIFNRFGTIEFLRFACVCKSWRAVALAFKQQFMASKPPLIFLSSTKARKYCYFYNVFDESLYKTALPHLRGNKCVGFTCGYLVFRDSSMRVDKPIWLVNPFTRHELKFPTPPIGYTHVILASLPNKSPVVDQQYLVVAYSKHGSYIQFCWYGDSEWTVRKCNTLDVVAFKGKIYVMTNQGRLGIVRLTNKYPNHPTVTMLPLPATTNVSTSAYDHVIMVGYNEGLYLLHFGYSDGFKKMERLDFERMVWERVNDNNNNKENGEVIWFSAEMKSCGFSVPLALPAAAPKRVGMVGKPLNGVWYIEENGRPYPWPYDDEGHNYIYSPAKYVTSRVSESILGYRKDGTPNVVNLSSPFWYFPHLSCTVDVVNLDD